MKNYTQEIEECKKILSSVEIDKIHQSGIKRDMEKYHATVMYPGVKAMEPIKAEEIFKNTHAPAKQFTLYIHMPFCSGHCSFCYFHTISDHSADSLDRYLKYLSMEARMLVDKITKLHGSVRLSSIFLGGGTPTLFEEGRFTSFMNELREIFEFAEDCEITAEVHPEIWRSEPEKKLKNLRENGINRLNIGIQSFNEKLLQETNRRHTVEEAVNVYKLARELGINNINLDLLYPLPGLTPEIWADSLEKVFALEPNSVTTYFTSFKSDKFKKLLKNTPEKLPDDYNNHLFRIMTTQWAKKAGYDDESLVDWYVAPQKEIHYKHQEREAKQTEDFQLLAIGSGAFTYYNHHQYFTIPDLQQYYEALDKGEYPTWRGIYLTKDERLARSMVMGLKGGSVDKYKLAEQFGADVLSLNYADEIEFLTSLGLIIETEEEIKLTLKGRLFADEISVRFASKKVKEKVLQKEWLQDKERTILERYDFIYDLA